MRILALGGIVGPVLFAISIAACAALRPGYSHVTNMISELGANGTSNAALMNYAGFIPAGLMFAAFGIALAGFPPRNRVVMTAAVLVILFGIGVMAAGIFSCDPGCPQNAGSLENQIHDKIAPATFLCLILATAFLGIHFFRLRVTRWFALYSLSTSGLALFFLAALANSLEARSLTGLWQRLMLATLLIWCAVAGLRVYRGVERSGRV